MTTKYKPGVPSSSDEDAKGYAYREFQAIGEFADLPTVSRMRFEVWHTEPSKPRAGDVVYADGTDWQSSEGLYLYLSTGSWAKLD